MSGASLFKMGDKVVLRDPESFLQPFRRLGHEGREAMVLTHSVGGISIKIAFDVKRSGAIPQVLWVHPNDIKLAPP